MSVWSLLESPRHAMIESPLHALNANPAGAPTYWGILLVASSPRPVFNGLKCNGPSGDTVADALASDTYYLEHGWELIFDPPTDSIKLAQTDSADANSFVLSAVVNEDTFPGGFWPGGDANAIPNHAVSYSEVPGTPDYDPANGTSSAGNLFNQGPTRKALLQAVNGADFSQLWSGAQIPVSGPVFPDSSGPNLVGFYYDRLFDVGVQPPDALLDGVLKQIAGAGINATQQFPPNDVLRSGVDANGQISYTRAQVKIRGFAGAKIEYHFIEVYNGLRWHSDTQGFENESFYRAAGDGFFTEDNQIVEIPLPQITTMPATLTTPIGDWATTAGETWMIIGQTTAAWLADRGVGPGNILP